MNRNDYGGLKHSKQYHVWMTQHSNITLMYGTCLGQDYLLVLSKEVSNISHISKGWLSWIVTWKAAYYIFL